MSGNQSEKLVGDQWERRCRLDLASRLALSSCRPGLARVCAVYRTHLFRVFTWRQGLDLHADRHSDDRDRTRCTVLRRRHREASA
jgi:hypothetical protein